MPSPLSVTLRRTLAAVITTTLTGCALPPAHDPVATQQRLDTLLPADALLLGEQHDAPDHQRIHQTVVQALAARGELAALALEMAEQGHSTAGLAREANEELVRAEIGRAHV